MKDGDAAFTSLFKSNNNRRNNLAALALLVLVQTTAPLVDSHTTQMCQWDTVSDHVVGFIQESRPSVRMRMMPKCTWWWEYMKVYTPAPSLSRLVTNAGGMLSSSYFDSSAEKQQAEGLRRWVFKGKQSGDENSWDIFIFFLWMDAGVLL